MQTSRCCRRQRSRLRRSPNVLPPRSSPSSASRSPSPRPTPWTAIPLPPTGPAPAGLRARRSAPAAGPPAPASGTTSCPDAATSPDVGRTPDTRRCRPGRPASRPRTPRPLRRCQATVKTDPLATRKLTPCPGRSQPDEGMRGCRPVSREATGTDDEEVRRGGGDAASARARLGVEAHREGVRVQQEHGAPLRGGRRLDGVRPTFWWRQARGSGGVAGGALPSAPRQMRR